MTQSHVWYAAYGSNMHFRRLGYYLSGGRPPGSTHNHPGCRDPRPPAHAIPLMLPGRLYFAMDSTAWKGGIAFYDPLGPGETPARAYLLTSSQFSDIVAQEMHRQPGTDLDLAPVIKHGRDMLGPGEYETLVLAGWVDDLPVITFTAPWRCGDVTWTRPTGDYLRNLASGLREAHGWSPRRIAEYLSALPGAFGHWTAADVEDIVPDVSVN